MDHPLLNNQLDFEIISLLTACAILPLEKRIWLSALPQMTDEEKQKLKDNLQRELKAQMVSTDRMTKKFVAALAQ